MNYFDYYNQLDKPENFNLIQRDILLCSNNLTSCRKSGIYFFKLDYINIPSLHMYLTSIGAIEYVRAIGHTVLHGHDSISVHRDPPTHKWSLLIPLRNNEHTENVFYESNNPPTVKSITKDDGNIITWDDYDINDCKEICKVIITTPTYINTQKIHTANNLGTSTREMLIIRLNNNFNIEHD